MNVATLLTECRASGVTIRLDGDLLRLRGTPEAVAAAKARLRPHKQQIILHLLAQFRIDVSADESEPQLCDRINNMAWEFMQADGMTFEAAIKVATDVVLHGHVAACEAAYTDVRALWRRLSDSVLSNPNLKAKND